MIRYTLPDSRVLSQGEAFRLNDVSYPSNWLELASVDDLAALSIETEVVEPEPPPPPDLNAYLADKRYQVETGGVILPGEPPMPCWTDRATQATLARAVQLLDKGMLSEPLNVKVPGGFISLSRLQVEAIGEAVALHVQACFDMEATIAGQIANGTITTTSDIDAANWPSNV